MWRKNKNDYNVKMLLNLAAYCPIFHSFSIFILPRGLVLTYFI